MVDTTAGLALRSTDRASPVVILGLAMFLGAGVSAVAARVRRTGLVLGGLAVAAVIGATTPLWTGAIIANGFTQPATPPLYVRQAAAALDKTHPGTRVYALPGNNFAAYRWGDTIDTVYPGLMTRPFVTHEQQIMGSLATADLLQAVDTPLQDGTMDWNALAPMASLMSAGDVLVQYDQAYERYDTPNPQQVAARPGHHPGRPAPTRCPTAPRGPTCPSSPTSTRPPWPARPTRGGPPPWSPTRWPTPGPMVRTESTTSPLVVDGNASGIVNAVVGRAAGRQPDHPLRRHPGHRPAAQEGHPGPPADLVVTDTNRKQGYRVEHPHREHRLHRDRGPGAGHLRPEPTTRSTCSPRPRPTPRPPRCPAGCPR